MHMYTCFKLQISVLFVGTHDPDPLQVPGRLALIQRAASSFLLGGSVLNSRHSGLLFISDFPYLEGWQNTTAEAENGSGMWKVFHFISIQNPVSPSNPSPKVRKPRRNQTSRSLPAPGPRHQHLNLWAVTPYGAGWPKMASDVQQMQNNSVSVMWWVWHITVQACGFATGFILNTQ